MKDEGSHLEQRNNLVRADKAEHLGLYLPLDEEPSQWQDRHRACPDVMNKGYLTHDMQRHTRLEIDVAGDTKLWLVVAPSRGM